MWSRNNTLQLRPPTQIQPPTNRTAIPYQQPTLHTLMMKCMYTSVEVMFRPSCTITYLKGGKADVAFVSVGLLNVREGDGG
mmetsp:Transcript_22614/g.37247  ORF Transcript_22614/g.37247 Transcript_22614/m.37247 type:complete len:81 (-) Transcript_22614:1301-1543(-)